MFQYFCCIWDDGAIDRERERERERGKNPLDRNTRLIEGVALQGKAEKINEIGKLEKKETFLLDNILFF
jgi:hypothetical protein